MSSGGHTHTHKGVVEGGAWSSEQGVELDQPHWCAPHAGGFCQRVSLADNGVRNSVTTDVATLTSEVEPARAEALE